MIHDRARLELIAINCRTTALTIEDSRSISASHISDLYHVVADLAEAIRERDNPGGRDVEPTPDATGNLSSEAFVRELRDGWR